ncbi:flagellar biosynthesis protein FlhB [Paenibacillus selenitireducens]|uniref:Flagellar biosynthetic protein FlhB n=1 Tax=Paenibacillus selenitireducens TaxID=1324314 RepID=A0A1T2XCI3_9BACL|nr:flagellar biosynthesis protein FlhB [Paenibacillus selenitireducens]OPA77609.1 flagellar biosynthesis protein FlhB [Paenibacillus selenitireducens]
MELRYQLDLQLFSQEKTEKATPKKRQESRKKGQVAKSSDISGASVLLGAFMCLLMLGGFFKTRLLSLFTDPLLHRMNMTFTQDNIMQFFGQMALQIFIFLAPIFIMAVLLGLLANYLQVGFLFTGDPIKMKLSKLDPIKGFKNIFSTRSLVEFTKSIIKLTVIGLLVYTTIIGQKSEILQLSHATIPQIFSFAASVTLGLGIKIASVLLVIAGLDYLYQRYEHEKSLRMSKQDIKDEYKKMEGDPLIKGKIRERQRRMAVSRMMQEVPKADVIITNPTHFAVAIRYDASIMHAPEIIAKGQDYVALKIKELAKEHGIITMENKPLARALYAQAEIGDTIPPDLFQAVAEVLAYVYKLKGRVKSR